MPSASSDSCWWATIGAREPHTLLRPHGRSDCKGSWRYPSATARPRPRIRYRTIRRGRTGISGTSASSEDAWRWNKTAAGCADGFGKHGLRIGILMIRSLRRRPGPSRTQTSWRYRFIPTATGGAMRPETVGTTRSKPAWRHYPESVSVPRSYTERMTERPFRRRRRAKNDTLRARTKGRPSAAVGTFAKGDGPARGVERVLGDRRPERPSALDKTSQFPP